MWRSWSRSLVSKSGSRVGVGGGWRQRRSVPAAAVRRQVPAVAGGPRCGAGALTGLPSRFLDLSSVAVGESPAPGGHVRRDPSGCPCDLCRLWRCSRSCSSRPSRRRSSCPVVDLRRDRRPGPATWPTACSCGWRPTRRGPRCWSGAGRCAGPPGRGGRGWVWPAGRRGRRAGPGLRARVPRRAAPTGDRWPSWRPSTSPTCREGLDLETALARLRGLPGVRGAEPIAVLPVCAVPDDSLWSRVVVVRAGLGARRARRRWPGT